jgi:predicted transcriptional regulator
MADIARLNGENKTSQIKRLADEGVSHREIAEIVGTTLNTVSVMLNYARNGYGRKNRKAMVVRMNPTVRDVLAREAKRRRMREQDLARIILETVVRDGLFGAIFDDQADT